MGQVLDQSTGRETGAGFLPIKTSLSFGRPEKVLVFFSKRVFSDCKLSILKYRKGIYWFNSFRLITGLLPPSFFFTINILLKNWSFCGQTCSTAPFFKGFSTSNEIVSFSCIEKFISFGSLFCFGLQRNGISLDHLCRIFWSFVSFSSCPGNALIYLPASGTAGIFKLLITTLLVALVVEFLWRRLPFWLPKLLNCAFCCSCWTHFWNWNHCFFTWS